MRCDLCGYTYSVGGVVTVTLAGRETRACRWCVVQYRAACPACGDDCDHYSVRDGYAPGVGGGRLAVTVVTCLCPRIEGNAA